MTSVQRRQSSSQAWHRAFGFVELPDLRYAQAYYRCARQEPFRHEQQGLLTAETRAALQAEVERWRTQVEELERLEKAQGYHASSATAALVRADLPPLYQRQTLLAADIVDNVQNAGAKRRILDLELLAQTAIVYQVVA